ncbi:GGDEF domain-containing protein [Halomonas sp.]|uniref:GGDEF domain-containing protein n=1 Tax=Halomonas sp. TaxID=1486246 RepID=UPI00384F1D0D
MRALLSPDPDDFPCGCLVVSGIDEPGNRLILYANHYVSEQFGFAAEGLVGSPLSGMLSRASTVIFDVYVLPTVLHEGRCSEVLLELQTPTGSKCPVVVNARRHSTDQTLIVLSLFDATQRDTLYQELVETRRLLEEKATILQHLSSTDELTGLLNRRELNKRAAIMLAEARRYETSVAVLVVDIDHFKELNDTLGHAGGDKILAELGKRFREQGRATDIVARYGGEEFVFVVPKMDEFSVRQLAQRLHKVASEVPVPGKVLTVSIGIGLTHSRDDFLYETLFMRADKALYAAKAAGRDRSLFFDVDAQNEGE